jgi:hypothetical protein
MTTETASDLDLFEAEATGQPAHKSEKAPSDKYAGKSPDDLIEMHRNAERVIGRQSQEIGTLRRVSDQLLDLKKPTTEIKKEEAHQPVTVDQLLNDPDKALNRAVDKSDAAIRARNAEERVSRLESSITQERFVSKHKDFARDLDEPTFKEWVAKNPVRVGLGNAAAGNDWQAATALWDMWDEHKELTSGGKSGASESRTSGTRKVPTTIKGSPSEGMPAEQVYSRAKLMELRTKVNQGDAAASARWNDPEFQRRMHTAYAENRVR